MVISAIGRMAAKAAIKKYQTLAQKKLELLSKQI
jgi:hypothetical protein